MKKMISRLVALALTFSICLSSLVIPASAASAGEFIDTASVNAWASVFSAIDSSLDFSSVGDVFPGGVVEPEVLVNCLNLFNGNGEGGGFFADTLLYNRYVGLNLVQSFNSQIFHGRPEFVIEVDPFCNNVARIKEQKTGRWFVNADGSFPYCDWNDYQNLLKGVSSDNGGSGVIPSTSDSLTTGRWMSRADAKTAKRLDVVSSSRLEEVAAALATKYPNQIALGTTTLNNVKYRVICRYIDDKNKDYGFWSTARGLMVSLTEPDKAAVNNPTINNFTDGTVLVNPGGTNVEEQNVDVNVDLSAKPNYETLVDIEKMQFNPLEVNGETVVIGDGTQFIDSITYNTDNSTYTVNTYDITQNTTNNYYEYNYYTYNIQYTYNNTYVTYIGSTAEFQPTEYELYYELPDGRSSADLTEEDIAGLSFQFADCINYKRGVTDESLLALYHFDGNTDDDSYYTAENSFTWNKGASITFMESNAFNGALYLDEKEHEFTLNLPKSLGAGNFTLQFRYYQNSATTSNNNDNYITSNGVKLFGWSEQQMYALGTTALSTGLSVGTWQEIALIRVGSTLYFYHNGIVAGTASLSSVLGSSIVFHFGPSSKAHAMLDELRVLDFAYRTGGAAYLPSSVPFDTNEVLVLPDVSDSGKVLVDQYMEYTYDVQPVLKFDASDSSTYSVYTDVATYNETNGGKFTAPRFSRSDLPSASSSKTPLWVNGLSSNFSVDSSAGLASVSLNQQFLDWRFGYIDDSDYTSGFLAYRSSAAGPVLPLYNKFGGMNAGIMLSGNYTFTVVFDDYSMASASFNVAPSGTYSDWVASGVTYNLSSGTRSLSLGVNYVFGGGQWYFSFLSLFGSSTFRYFELIPGTTPNPHQVVYDYYEWNDILVQPNTAAIQTNIPIHGYTVGGVRPTFPVRGDVWFPAEGSRISGVQVYNGRAWEETNARYWTGKRWIPIYAFDLVTLADMWDVSGSDGQDVTPSITSESGFWNWWKNQWLDFRAWLTSWSPGGGSGGGGSSTIPDGSLPPEEGVEEGNGWNALDLLVALKDGVWKIVKGTVSTVFGGLAGLVGGVVDVGNYFDAFDSSSPDNIFGITDYGGADIWD